MNDAFVFAPATRGAAFLKLGIQGPAGCGKTEGALAIATQLAGEGGRVAVVDTENRSSELYAHRYRFAILDLKPPFESARYRRAIETAVAAGFTVVVVDSLSHQWAGQGGILERQGAAARKESNSYTAWRPFTKEHDDFKQFLVDLNVHLLVTMRSKTEYVIEKDDRGRSVPRRIGTKAIQREGTEYELTATVELRVDTKHGTSSKDRTGVLTGELDLRDPALGARLRAWTFGNGAVAAPVAAPAAVPNGVQPAPDSVALEITRDTPFPGDRNGRMKGTALKDWPLAQLSWVDRSQPSLFESVDLNTAWLLAIRDELKQRAAAKAS